MKKLKSSLALLLVFMMLVSLFPTSAFAMTVGEAPASAPMTLTSGAGATITVGSITEAVEPGATISIPVTIANNPGFAGATFDVEYDANVLEPAKNSKGKDILFTLGQAIKDAVGYEDTNMSLTAASSAMLSADDEDFVDDGEILVLNFKVKENAAVTSTTVSLKLQDGLAKNFSDIDGTEVDVSFVSGTVAINGEDLGPVVTVENWLYTELEGTFDTLEAAFAKNEPKDTSLYSFKACSTATLLRDSDEETASYGKVDTLDLGGYTIGTLNMIGVQGKNTQSSVVISDGIINGEIGTLNVQGCMGTDSKARWAELCVGDGAKVGTINVTAYAYMSIQSGAEITTLNYDGGSNPYIRDGCTIGTLNVLSTNSTGVDISGGTIDAMTVANGATVKISGGTFGFDPTPWLNKSYTDAANGYHYEVQKTGESQWQVVKVNAPRFVVNGVNYDSGSAACTAAGNGGTVTLGSAYKAGIDVYVQNGVIVDLNGHSLQNSGSYSNVISAAQGTLTNTGAAATVTLTGEENVFNVSSNSYTTTIDTPNTTYSITGTGKLLGNSFDWAGYKWGNFVIKNGTFNITADQLGTYFNTLKIEGGSFKFDPTAYVDANSYHVTYNNATELYDVFAHTCTPTYTWADDNSTCTASGTCSCGKALSETVNTSSETVKATAAAAGKTTYTAAFTEDWAAQQTKDVQDIAVIAHSYGTVTYTWANDNSACTAEHTCTCGDKQTANATVTSVVSTASTCQTTGNRTYTATFSESWAETQNKTVNGSESALGHAWGEASYSWSGASCTATRSCTREGCTTSETETVTGSYVKDTDASCLVCEKGHYAAAFQNSAFAAQNTAANGVDKGEPLGHSFTNYVSDNNATCTADGTKTAKCDRCDATDTVTDEGSKVAHSFTNYVSDNNATCTMDGTKTAKCDNCTATDTVTDAGSAKGHSFTNYVSDNNATCTEDGTKTAQCDRCVATDTKTDADSKLGHNIVKDPAVPATTFSTGLTEGEHCTRCDYKIAQQVVDMLPAPQDEEKTEVAVVVEENATEVESTIPAAAFQQKSENEETKPVTIKAEGFAEITFDSAAASAIAGNAGSAPVSLSVEKATVETKQAAITAAGIQDVVSVVLSFSMKAGENDVFGSENAQGTAQVSVPFTPANPNAVILVYYIDGNNKTLVPATYVDGKLTITVEHFSDYVVCEHDQHSYVDHFCTVCGEADEHLKFYFGVTSGNTVDAVVGDDYNLVVRLPEDGSVSTSSVTVTAKMQNVASLGVDGTREHSITVNTGLGANEVNLKTWLNNAYSFGNGVINANIDGKAVSYTFARDGYKITGTTDEAAARAAWQALTSHVETTTQAQDDSFISIANGSYIKMGTEYLCFEDDFSGDLKLDNFSDLDAMNTTVRDAVCLKTIANQGGVITMVVKAGTQLAVGSSVATLNDDYLIVIEGNADVFAALNGTLAAIRDANGKTAMVKKMVEAFNKVIGVVDACSAVNVTVTTGHVHEFTDGVCACGELAEDVKFYFGVTSGNTVDAVVGDDYNLVVRLPENGSVSTSSVTVTAKMQNVASLGVDGTREHSITVNTGLGANEVNLKTWLNNAYNFGNGVINANIDGKAVSYTFARDGYKITGTTDEADARAAWQALTSHVETTTQAQDDSYISIANGSFIAMGTEYLRFEDEFTADALVLNNFSNLDAMNTDIRNAVYLDTVDNQGGKITMVVKAGTKLAVGSSVATLKDDYIITIEGNADTFAALNGTLAAIRDANGKTAMVKKMVEAFNKVIGVVDACESVSVEMKVLDAAKIEYKAAEPAITGTDTNGYIDELVANEAVKNYETGIVEATKGKGYNVVVNLSSAEFTDQNSQFVFDVKPVDVMGNKVSNDAILDGKKITFRLPVPASLTTGTEIAVLHRAKLTDVATTLGDYAVKETSIDNVTYKYLEIEADEFSYFLYNINVGPTPPTPPTDISFSKTLRLGGRIGIILYAENVTDPGNYYVTTTFLGVTTSKSFGLKGVGEGFAHETTANKYGVLAAEMTAYQMVDEVSMQVFYTETPGATTGGTAVSEVMTYSARQYAMNMINDSSKGTGVKDLCRALLDYGAKAQVYFGESLDNLANAGNYGSGVDLGTVTVTATFAKNTSTSISGIEAINKTLSLDAATGVVFYITLGSGANINDYSFSYQIGNKEAVATAATLCKDGRYMVVAEDIASYELGWETVLTISFGGSSMTCQYNALNFAESKQNSRLDLSEVCKTLYNYNQKAKAYWNLGADVAVTK